MYHSLRAGTYLCIGVLASAACERTEPPWRDNSDHHTQFVSVDNDVQLEVLDWGGDGRPVILLAGLGNTAHVYDDLAPQLAGDHHLYGITRRGFGASSWPDSGYVVERLSEDIRAAIEALDLDDVVLVGHSLGGVEITHLLTSGFERASGAIYLDGAYDLRIETFAPRLREIFDGLPQPPTPPTDPEEFRKIYGYAMPEVELRNQEAHPEAWGASGHVAPEFARIQVPTLAIYAAFRSPDDLAPWVMSAVPDPGVRREMFSLRTEHLEQNVGRYRETPRSRVVLLEGADHYVFLTHEGDVLREMRVFLDDLEAESAP